MHTISHVFITSTFKACLEFSKSYNNLELNKIIPLKSSTNNWLQHAETRVTENWIGFECYVFIMLK